MDVQFNDSDAVCYFDEIIIEGITVDGVKFRPSDWVDRLCGMLAVFDNQKVTYSPYLRPMIHDDMSCVAVKKSLQTANSDAFKFIMQFAEDNKLVVINCAEFKKQVEL